MTTTFKHLLTIIIFSFFFGISLAAEQRIHQHRIMDITLVMEDGQVEIEVDSPSDNFLGFEHQPKTKKEKKFFKKQINLLKKAHQLQTINKSAKCKLQSVDVHAFEEDSDEHSDDEHADEDAEDIHSDIAIHYTYQCKQPLKSVSLAGWFKVFPRLEKIKLKWVRENTQGWKEIKVANSTLTL